MDNATKATHYLELANDWQAQADVELNKALENSMTSRELHAAIMRRDRCLQQRDACAEKARSLAAAA